MSKELKSGLENIQAIKSINELSLLMEAIAGRMRDLSIIDQIPPTFKGDDENVLKIKQRSKEIASGKVKTISREELMKRVYQRMSK